MKKESDRTPEIDALIEKWKKDPAHQRVVKLWELHSENPKARIKSLREKHGPKAQKDEDGK